MTRTCKAAWSSSSTASRSCATGSNGSTTWSCSTRTRSSTFPQWDSEHVYTTDPKRGMSLMYYPTRAGLEDRVFRIGTGKSAASTPMPRTLHLINNVTIQQVSDSQLEAKAKWVTHVYRFGQSTYFYGDASYLLKPVGFSWIILKKHVVLLNDTIDSVLDFYHV